jgi:hypothetical protein
LRPGAPDPARSERRRTVHIVIGKAGLDLSACVLSSGEQLGRDRKSGSAGALPTVVTEARSNVVRHAYPTEAGSFEFEARPVEGEVVIVVRDFGQGMQPWITEDEPSMRLGPATPLSSAGPSGRRSADSPLRPAKAGIGPPR